MKVLDFWRLSYFLLYFASFFLLLFSHVFTSFRPALSVTMDAPIPIAIPAAAVRGFDPADEMEVVSQLVEMLRRSKK